VVLHVLAATLVATVLRLFHLGAQSLWIDEVFTWFAADVGQPLRVASLLENVHGPLYSLILHGWGALAGDSEWALRAPSLVCGVAVVPALAWLSARWLGRETVPWAAWLAAGSPFLVWYSQEARNYMMVILCVCLAGVVLLGPPGVPLRRTVGTVAVAGAGLLSNFSFGLLAPLHLRWWFAGARGQAPPPGEMRRRTLGLLAVGVALAVLLSPWVPQVFRTWDWTRLRPARPVPVEEVPLRGSTTFHAAAVPFALHSLAVGYTLGPSLRDLRSEASSTALARHWPVIAAVTLVFGVLGLAGLGALARRRRLADALLWLAVPALVVSLFALQNFKVFHPRYLAVCAPGFLLVLAAALAELRRPQRIAAGLAVGLIWTVSLAHHYFDPRYGKEDYRGAIRFVSENAGPGEKVLAVGAEEPIYYYYRGPLPVDRLWLGFVADPRRLGEELDGKLAGARGTWVVLSRPEDLDPGSVFVRTLEARHPGVEQRRFEGVRVWHVGPWNAGAAASP
jgi:mannosyltransferase